MHTWFCGSQTSKHYQKSKTYKLHLLSTCYFTLCLPFVHHEKPFIQILPYKLLKKRHITETIIFYLLFTCLFLFSELLPIKPIFIIILALDSRRYYLYS